MKKLFAIFILLSVFTFGQDKSLKIKKDKNPLFIINGHIANQALMKTMKNDKISSITIYKSNPIPDALQAFKNFAPTGIVDIRLVTEQTLSTLIPLRLMNTQFNLDPENPIYINGDLITNNSTSIFKDAIIESKIIDNNGKSVLNIWTLSENERRGIVPEIKTKIDW